MIAIPLARNDFLHVFGRRTRYGWPLRGFYRRRELRNRDGFIKGTRRHATTTLIIIIIIILIRGEKRRYENIGRRGSGGRRTRRRFPLMGATRTTRKTTWPRPFRHLRARRPTPATIVSPVQFFSRRCSSARNEHRRSAVWLKSERGNDSTRI